MAASPDAQRLKAAMAALLADQGKSSFRHADPGVLCRDHLAASGPCPAAYVRPRSIPSGVARPSCLA